MERLRLPLLKTGFESRRHEEDFTRLLHEGGEFQEQSATHTAEVLTTAPLGDESHLNFASENGHLEITTTLDAFAKSDKGGRTFNGSHYEGTGDYGCHMRIRPILPEELQDIYKDPIIIINRLVDHLSPPGRKGLELWQELIASSDSPLKAIDPYIFLFADHFAQPFPDIAGSVMSAGIDLSTSGKEMRQYFSEEMIGMLRRKTTGNWYPEPFEMPGSTLTLHTLVEQQLASIRKSYNRAQYDFVTAATDRMRSIELPYATSQGSVPEWRRKWDERGKAPLTVQDFFSWCMNGPSIVHVAAGYEHEGIQYISVASSNPMADIYDSIPGLIDPLDRQIVDGNLLLDQVIYDLYEAYGKDDYFLLWSLIEKAQLANYGIQSVPGRNKHWYDTDVESHNASRNHTYMTPFTRMQAHHFPLTLASSSDGWNHTTRDPQARHSMSLAHETIFALNSEYYDRLDGLFRNQSLTDDATRIVTQINLKN